MIKKLVCFPLVATHLGGGERSLLELLIALKHGDQYEPWVIVPKEDGPLVEVLKVEKIEFTVLPFPRSFIKMSRGTPLASLALGAMSLPAMSIYMMKLLSLLRGRKPALIHTQAIKTHFIGAQAGTVLRIPVLWHLRDILPKGPTLIALKALSVDPNVRIVANSKATAEAFGGKVHVIHNGLSPEKYPIAPNHRFHERFGIDRDKPLVGMIGVLARWKGQPEFIEMARKLIEGGSDAHFVIIGDEIYDTGSDSGYGAKLREKAADLKGRVHFAGYESDPALAINGLDVLVHASIKPEPFGRVVIEGMACGVPVVASADGGVLEIVKDDETGFLIAPADVGAMVRRVSKLVVDPKLRKEIGQAGRKEFLARFTRDAHVRVMLSVYDSI